MKNNFDDLNQIGGQASTKAEQLEAAIRSGKFDKEMYNKESKNDDNSSSSDSSSDEVDDEEIAPIGNDQKLLAKRLTAKSIVSDAKKRQSVAVK